MVASLRDRAKGSPSSVQQDQEQRRPGSHYTSDRYGRGICPYIKTVSVIGSASKDRFVLFGPPIWTNRYDR